MTITAKQYFLTDNLKTKSLQAQNELGKRFFSSIKLKNGTFKTTWANRMEDINKKVSSSISELDIKPVRFWDIGVSSGQSTIDWYLSLKDVDLEPHLTGTDLYLKAFLYSFGYNINILVDKDGFPLQYDIGGIGFKPWIRKLDFLSGYWVISAILSFFYKKLGIADTIRKQIVSMSEKKQVFNNMTEFLLLDPKITKYPDLQFIDDDILDDTMTLGAKFDMVRAANVLNRGYFSDAQLKCGLTKVRNHMNGTGSLLLICRTKSDGSNHATLFRLNSRKSFDVITRYGNGTEIEDIVMKL